MYKRKGSEHVVHLKRFLSHSTDSLRRLKVLRSELEKVSVSEAKQITEDYSATVFYVIYTSFTSIEAIIREKVLKGKAVHEYMKELKEVILPSFERVIILLPEKVHKKWEYNSICLMIRKLLHPDNILELRQYGIKLLVLWLQALQENSGDAAIELFASAVPYFPPKKTPMGLPDQSPTPSGGGSPGLTLCDRYGLYSRNKSDSSLTSPAISFHNPSVTTRSSYTCLSKSREWVATREIRPLFSSSILPSGSGTDHTLDLMDYLLNCLTTQVGRLKWVDTSNHVRGFSFLFFQFKLFYLACLYRNFRSDAGLYCQPPSPSIEIPVPRDESIAYRRDPSPLATSTGITPKHSKTHLHSMSAVIKLDYDTSDPIYTAIRQLILKFLLKWIMSGFHSNHSVHPSPPTPSPALNSSIEQSFIPKGDDLIRDMWMTSKDNINLLFEICHQGFKLPVSHFGYVNKLTQLYLSWIQQSDKPLFMQQPPPPRTVSLPVGVARYVGGVSQLAVTPWEIYSGYSNFDSSDVRAGPQYSMRMFIAHTRQLFLHKAPAGMINNQVESGQRIISFYQEIMLQWSLDLEGWIYLLKVLLHLCLELLRNDDQSNGGLGTKLANSLIQTLLVGYVRASMCYELPVELWDSLMDVLSYLTSWAQVIAQWSEIMRNLTHCLSKVVYHLDLDDLPLDQDHTHFRPRTHTTTPEINITKKQAFTDIKPRPPRSNTLSERAEFTKAMTFDTNTSSAQSSPGLEHNEDRRFSTPARTSPLVSSAIVTRRQHIIRHNAVIEEETPCDLLLTTPTDNQNILSRGRRDTLGKDLSLVISNEDVSSEKEEDLSLPSPLGSPSPFNCPVDSSDHTPISGSAPSPNDSSHNATMRRSVSENTSLVIKNNNNQQPLSTYIRSLSPDLSQKLKSRPLATRNSLFTEFIPKPVEDSAHSQATPTNNMSPSPITIPIVQETKVIDETPISNKEGQWNIVSISRVWVRMLRALGDINDIKDPMMHSRAMSCLKDLLSYLQQIENNSGVSVNNETTPTLPPHLPPVMLVLPWIVKACYLPSEYKEGRNIAYLVLCDTALRHVSCTIPPVNFLSHFYCLMHQGLQPSSDVLFTAIKGGMKLLSFGLEGASVLYEDIVKACSHVLDSKNTEAPRTESLTLLGDLYYLSNNIPDLMELVAKLIFKAALSEPSRQARCLALFQVGMVCVKELKREQPSDKVATGLDILLASLKFPELSIVLSSVDMLSLLIEQVEDFKRCHPTLQCRAIQALTSVAADLINAPSTDKKIKMLISVLLCLRDWTVGISIDHLCQGTLLANLLEVLYAAASGATECIVVESPVQLLPDKLEESPHKYSSGSRFLKRAGTNTSLIGETMEHVETISKSIIHHLLNLVGHFPFPCGAAQMTSVVCEYHDCPSLEYLEELSPEMFDSPRVQLFSLNDDAIVTFVEIPTLSGKDIPTDSFSTANYHCRIIIRDVTGKYSWDSTVLFGPKQPNLAVSPSSAPLLMKPFDSSESLSSGTGESDRSSSSLVPPEMGGTEFLFDGNILQPPSWNSSDASPGTDHLNKLLGYIESTSSECVLYPDVGLTEPAPAVNEPTHLIERKLQLLIDQQNGLEANYITNAASYDCMRSLPTLPPDHCTMTFAFHYCHLFLSHMGYLSWNKRNCLELLDKTDHLIRELKHLDGIQTQCRQTYKVAVLYVSFGQEDRHSILCNSEASKPFEEFVSGLGWEVDMNTHLGYTGGFKQFSQRTMPYYATASEEILFHVSTRMSSTGSDIEQKVRHLGNDEVHIVWSEHWRDYRRSIFKTSFADILLIIYPLSNGLFRIQIEKKNNIQFGPLFDGAVIDKDSLPVLVRATAINALRSLRSPFFSYRGRYQDRWKYIKGVGNMKVKSTFEDFAQSVMHPLESGHQQNRQSPTKMVHSIAQTSSLNLASSLDKVDRQYETRWALEKALEETVSDENRKPNNLIAPEFPSRPRSRTADGESSHFIAPQLTKNRSVPDNLCDISGNANNN